MTIDSDKSLIERVREAAARFYADDVAHPYVGMNTLLLEVAVELEESDRMFDSMWKANMRGTELWRAAGPDRELTLPDQAELVEFLLNEIERLKAKAP